MNKASNGPKIAVNQGNLSITDEEIVQLHSISNTIWTQLGTQLGTDSDLQAQNDLEKIIENTLLKDKRSIPEIMKVFDDHNDSNEIYVKSSYVSNNNDNYNNSQIYDNNTTMNNSIIIQSSSNNRQYIIINRSNNQKRHNQ